MARKKLGVLLEEKGIITEFQLVAGLSHQRKWKMRLGKALLELGYLEEKKLFEVLAEQWKMQLVDLDQEEIEEEARRKLSKDKGLALMAVPFKIEGEELLVAVSEPDKPKLKEELEKITGMTVKLVLGMDSQVEEKAHLLPEKVSVGAVKPVKKAFRKNQNGEVEPIPVQEVEPELLLGGKEIGQEDLEAPIPLEEVLSGPAPEEEAPALEVELPRAVSRSEQEVSKEPPLEAPEIKTESVPDSVVEDEAKELPSPKKIEPEAQTEPKSAGMEDFFPGQMRNIEEPSEKNAESEIKSEEGVEELSLPAQESVLPELKESEVSESGEDLFEKAEAPPALKEEPLSASLPEPEPEKPSPGLEPLPDSAISQPGKEPALKEVGDLAKAINQQEILQMVIEIDRKLKKIREMVKELKEKLESRSS